MNKINYMCIINLEMLCNGLKFLILAPRTAITGITRTALKFYRACWVGADQVLTGTHSLHHVRGGTHQLRIRRRPGVENSHLPLVANAVAQHNDDTISTTTTTTCTVVRCQHITGCSDSDADKQRFKFRFGSQRSTSNLVIFPIASRE